MGEKDLRALLAEAREFVASGMMRPSLINRIDAALAEPVLAPWEQRGVADDQMIAALREAQRERDEARAEVERLKGVTPELSPRPPDGVGLPRYGLRWNGPTEPVAVPLPDGYWTPWHLADAGTQRAEIEREHAGRALEDAIALQRAACAGAYQRGAKEMRALAAKSCGAADVFADIIRDLPLPKEEP